MHVVKGRGDGPLLRNLRQKSLPLAMRRFQYRSIPKSRLVLVVRSDHSHSEIVTPV